MSSSEADYNRTSRDDDEQVDEEEEEEERTADERRSKKHKKKHQDEDEDEDEEEDDEDEDEDDEEDDDDDDPGEARGKKRRKRHKKPAVNRFLDLQAVVDDDEDEEDDDEDYGKDDFLEPGHEDEDLDDYNRRAADHARLDRREREISDQDLERIAQDVTRRYRPTATKYTGDMNEIPQRLLMPSVQDANLWQVRVRPGKERDIVFQLIRKAVDLEFGAHPLQILSAFQRDSLPGIIYVEARSSQQVTHALNGLVGVFPSRGVTLVPIKEMASLLQIKKKETTITPGSWVRIRRGKYGGDLAQVLDIAENGEEVGLKFVPRIDLNPKDDLSSLDGRKRKKASSGPSITSRPPQRFFNYEEVVKVHGRRSVAKRNQVYVFGNDTFRDGYIEKDIKISGLILENVNPTLDEIMKFTRQEDGTENEQSVDLSIIAEASKKEAITVLQPGDHVEVFEGEQLGVHGVVESIANDVVTLRAQGVDIEGQKVDVPARSVRKRFKPGDHVKVMAGRNADETGLVVSVQDNVVTFLSDMSLQEVSVFSKDLREAAEVGSSTNIVGNYELHDLVQLDPQTVGVIFKTERDSFRVLDQHSHVRLVQPHQISMRRDSNRAIATDSEGYELRKNDNVKEIDGEGRKGQVLHIHQSYTAFLFNREYTENGGVFVTRARSLASLAPKNVTARPIGSTDLSKMNPAVGAGVGLGMAQPGGTVGSQIGRGPKDRLAGVSVMIVKGPNKGHAGTIRDTNGGMARVELQTSAKVITIEKEKLRRRNPNGKLEPLEGGFGPPPGTMGPPSTPLRNGWGRTPNPYTNPSSRTPNPYTSSFNDSGRTPRAPPTRTPNPYAGDSGRTPAWNASARTPNPYAVSMDGGRTPAWNVSARTPNPYAQQGRGDGDHAGGAGNKTPAWGAGARTPNPYAQGAASGGGGGAGGAGGAGDGGKTPAWNPSSSSASTWGTTESGTWGWGEPASAPTPAAFAPTPGGGALSAQTPGIYGNDYDATSPAFAAPTPYAAAATPGIPSSRFDDDAQPSRWDTSDNESLRSDWLLAPQLRDKAIIVDIRGTRVGADIRWFNGEHEGKRGTVRYIQDQHRTNSESVADVILDSGSGERLTIPIKYLVPAPPVRSQARVIVVQGENVGQMATVFDVDGAGGRCTVQMESGVVDLPGWKLGLVAG